MPFHRTTPYGALGATQQVRDVADAAMSQLARFNGGIASAVVFGQGSEEGFHRAFDVLVVAGVPHSV
jgi:hypothetical protein